MNTSGQRENARLAELANVELLMETTRRVTLVVPQTAAVNSDLLLLLLLKLKLLAYPPMYTENEPPYELAPNMPAVVALHEVNDAVPTRTLALRTAVSPTAATASP